MGFWPFNSKASMKQATSSAKEPQSRGIGSWDDLSVVIPSRNRPRSAGALLRYLRECCVSCPILLADSSDSEDAEANAKSCNSTQSLHRTYTPDTDFYDKLLDALTDVTSTYVVMLPDDDIPMPHAMQEALAFMKAHRDYAVAWGYVLDFVRHSGCVDILRVRWFAPSVDESAPLDRTYHLVRRYQPFFWGVFRRDVLIRSLKLARDRNMIVFKEMAMTISAALQGKIGRLPVIYSLRGTERSLYDRAGVEPMFAFLADGGRLLSDYLDYKNSLIDFIERDPERYALPALSGCSLGQYMDLVHGLMFVREVDPGFVNYTIQRALGAPYPPIPAPEQPSWREPGEHDRVTQTPLGYVVWRQEVLRAEPKDEISISEDEMRLVEEQLNKYELG